MEYNVENFAMILLEESIAACDVTKVTAAWGEGENGYWQGGFCFTLEDDTHMMIIKLEDGNNQVFLDEDWGEPFTPPTEDYDEHADQIRRWLEDGCPPELHEY
ncbi:MAG: hypothetical protein ACXAD7_25485 [Candidatus Kariarchaeaceae archaeon]|jgi:hypothetical protein